MNANKCRAPSLSFPKQNQRAVTDVILLPWFLWGFSPWYLYTLKEVINVPKLSISLFRPKTKLWCFVFALQHCGHYRRRGFISASPKSRLFAHFRLSGSDARWRAAKMAAVDSAHFRLQKCSSETYEWRHGHYVHFFFLQSMVFIWF